MAKNALTESRILISKLEKEYDLVLKEVDSKNETIKKLTSQIGNLVNFEHLFYLRLTNVNLLM
jgi:hypothetical protein